MKPETKKKIKDGAKLAVRYAKAFLATVISAFVAVLMYLLYLPFAIGRAMFNRRAIRAFYGDFFDVCDIIGSRWREREEEGYGA